MIILQSDSAQQHGCSGASDSLTSSGAARATISGGCTFVGMGPKSNSAAIHSGGDTGGHLDAAAKSAGDPRHGVDAFGPGNAKPASGHSMAATTSSTSAYSSDEVAGALNVSEQNNRVLGLNSEVDGETTVAGGIAEISPTEVASTTEKETAPSTQEPVEVEGYGSAGGDESTGSMVDVAILPPTLEKVPKPLYLLEPLENIPPEATIPQHDIDLLHTAKHSDPFAVLGPHWFPLASDNSIDDKRVDSGGPNIGGIVIRLWKKDVSEVLLRPLAEHNFRHVNDNAKDEWIPGIRRCDWLYERAFRVVAGPAAPPECSDKDVAACNLLYEARVKYHGDPSNTWHNIRDTFNFGLLLPAYDLRLLQSGSCWNVDNLMGSHIMEVNGVRGVRFAVWAPHAVFLSVVGDWNQWDARAHPMRRLHEFNVWEIFIPNIGPNEKYGYRIHTPGHHDVVKIDPYAQAFENPPSTASIITAFDDSYKPPEERFQWTDQEWMANRIKLGKSNKICRIPMSIYEVHLPSWMRGDNNSYLSYRELAPRIVQHIKNMNFTHVEFLPLAHHPFEGSWGYQVSGQYAPYSRLGSADDFKFLVNELHRNNIGVFMDFVLAHFVRDDWGLRHYDGAALYEYADPREGEVESWGTMMFNFRQNEVRAFLLGAVYHWLKRYHIDGLRVDAVSSMIYKNHCRREGAWLPNEFGGDANLQAISLLQELNWVVHKEFPGVFTIAEESTSWEGVTDKKKGLGFDAKWDLGWMNDTLSYLCTPAHKRAEKHSKLTFRGLYLAHEKWVLPLSHDEVVSGKGSLVDKCGFTGTPFPERLRTLRALLGLQIAMPGRPLLFMGAEFGQGREWNESRSVDWHESREHSRSQTLQYVADLLHLYRSEVSLHAGDDEIWNFQWVDCDNANDNIIAWLRKYKDWYNDTLTVCNFSGVKHWRYPLGVPHGGEWKVLLNSDDWKYDGEMQGPGSGCGIHTTQGGRLGWPYCLWMDLPSFGCIIVKAPRPPKDQIEDK